AAGLPGKRRHQYSRAATDLALENSRSAEPAHLSARRRRSALWSFCYGDGFGEASGHHQCEHSDPAFGRTCPALTSISNVLNGKGRWAGQPVCMLRSLPGFFSMQYSLAREPERPGAKETAWGLR